ncbi:hypothetical protein RGQ15_10290 [Paracoccus sp. MBLB3053]|uniref:Histidine kinase n=1 Tax=Paracoccus aurantius TaxID=3073814 RepID=A0ABU2HSD4_9RHOB|nr:hypothetical protein [Paracoccus sp. MBLB3053]MDS9467954.1 hypothetical protein [Paracoccus sp. MBLB3053]
MTHMNPPDLIAPTERLDGAPMPCELEQHLGNIQHKAVQLEAITVAIEAMLIGGKVGRKIIAELNSVAISFSIDIQRDLDSLSSVVKNCETGRSASR